MFVRIGSSFRLLIAALGFVAGSVALVIDGSAQAPRPAPEVFPRHGRDASSPVLDALDLPRAAADDKADPFARLAGTPFSPVVTLSSGFAERAAQSP